MITGNNVSPASIGGASSFGLSHNIKNPSAPGAEPQRAEKSEPQAQHPVKTQEATGTDSANPHGPPLSGGTETNGKPPFSPETLSVLLRESETSGQFQIAAGEEKQGAAPVNQSPAPVAPESNNVAKDGPVESNGDNRGGAVFFAGPGSAPIANQGQLNGVPFRSGEEPVAERRGPKAEDSGVPVGQANNGLQLGGVAFKTPELTAGDLIGLSIAKALREVAAERAEKLELEREKGSQPDQLSVKDRQGNNGKGLALGKAGEEERLQHFNEFETGLRGRAGTVFTSSGFDLEV